MDLTQAKARVQQYCTDGHWSQLLLIGALDHAPTTLGRASVIANIEACGEDTKKLHDLATLYYTTIIVPVRAAAGKTPQPSGNPSTMEPDDPLSSGSPDQAKRKQKDLKDQLFLRDDYRCVVTGNVDSAIYDRPGDSGDHSGVVRWEASEAAHILPFSLAAFDDLNLVKKEQKRAIWNAIQAFSGVNLAQLGLDINVPENAMTLSHTVHKHFGALELAFDPIPVRESPNSYKILTFGRRASGMRFPAQVALRSADGTPLPDPTYLAIHCAICKVLWASGRGEELQKMFRDLEDTCILARDGSSADAVDIALVRSVVVH